MITTKTCAGCGKDFPIEHDGNAISNTLLRITRYCQPCSEIEIQRREVAFLESEKLKLIDGWKQICPPIFQETEIEKLPIPAKAMECLTWSGETGLMLYGDTRKGKSRCAWMLLRREYEKRRSIRIMDSLSGFEYASQFSRGAEASEAWIRERCQTGVLFMDDIFKAKLTDSYEAAIFAIVDYRLNHKKAILATCNDTGETLAARMTTDRGAAFVARLKECCQAIQF